MTTTAPTKEDPDASTSLPYSDVDAEQYLLAAAMWDPGAYKRAARIVNAAAFYRPAHAAIWAAVAHLRSGDQPCDPVMVSDRMRTTQDHVEHIRVVPRIFDLPWTPSGVNYHARIVAWCAVRRHVHAAAVRLAQATTLADSDQFRHEIDRAIARLTALAQAWDGAT